MTPGVLQLVQGFHQGGSERQAVQLTRLLLGSGHYRMHVACLNPTGGLRAEVERLCLPPIAEFPLTSFHDGNMLVQLRRFARFLRESAIDVVHTHDFYANIFGMTGAWLAGVPVRVASRRESAVKPALKRRVECGAYRLAHAVVANCHEVGRQLRQEGVSGEKIVVIPNGLDALRVALPPGVDREEARARLALHDTRGRPLVTIVANLHPVKDHETFLRAARRVHQEMPEAAFVLAGEGRLEASLRAQAAELGLEKDVKFLGPCRRIAELLAISDVCVLSSRAEGFSNAILEYMAAGRPVVATDVGGAREVMLEGETGYLVPSGNPAAMAERTLALLRDPDRARAFGERGRSIVTEGFSCAAQLARTEALYGRLLAERQAHGARREAREKARRVA
jgi:glycosyltransferase involved in cell wall biosynthesis